MAEVTIVESADGLVPLDSIRLVKELYPRLREDEAAVKRYRAAVDRLPPPVVARRLDAPDDEGLVLVDGWHRYQARRREGEALIAVEDLGELTDIAIIRESLRRNSSHGQQLSTEDKRRNADSLYRMLPGSPAERYVEIAELLSVTEGTAKKYCEEARRDEKRRQKEIVWDLWLDCLSEWAIRFGVLRCSCCDSRGYEVPPSILASGFGSVSTACSRRR